LETAEGVFFFHFLNLFESPGCTNGNGEGCVGVSGKDLANWKIISEEESVCPGCVRPRAHASKQANSSLIYLFTDNHHSSVSSPSEEALSSDTAHLTQISKRI
jgi:hypothetical protein